jgi:hypothetical protein
LANEVSVPSNLSLNIARFGVRAGARKVRTSRDFRSMIVEREKVVDTNVAVGIIDNRDIVVSVALVAPEANLPKRGPDTMILTGE